MWHLALFPARPTRCHVATNHMQLQSIPSAFYATARQTQIKRPICTLRHFSIELLSLPQSAEWSGAERSAASCKLQVANQPHQSRFADDDDDNTPVAMLLRRVANHIQQQVAKQICQSFDHLRCRMLHVVGRRLCLSSVAGLPRLGSLDFCNCSAVCACAVSSRLVIS